jgi:hypothetical protein
MFFEREYRPISFWDQVMLSRQARPSRYARQQCRQQVYDSPYDYIPSYYSGSQRSTSTPVQSRGQGRLSTKTEDQTTNSYTRDVRNDEDTRDDEREPSDSSEESDRSEESDHEEEEEEKIEVKLSPEETKKMDKIQAIGKDVASYTSSVDKILSGEFIPKDLRFEIVKLDELLTQKLCILDLISGSDVVNKARRSLVLNIIDYTKKLDILKTPLPNETDQDTFS